MLPAVILIDVSIFSIAGLCAER